MVTRFLFDSRRNRRLFPGAVLAVFAFVIACSGGSDNGDSTGEAGGSGASAKAGTNGSGAQGGYSYAIYDEDPDDENNASLQGNVMTGGNAGNGGGLAATKGEAGMTNYSGS